jgi:hypothetical protein
MNTPKTFRTKCTFAVCLILFPILVSAQQKPAQTANGQNDFDFEFGSWQTKLRRLKNPLSGSAAWVEYEGTTVVKKIFDGRANLVELNVKGNSGSIEGISLRLFNPETNQWSLNFANMRDGNLAIPAVGGFKDGRGEFFNEDTYNGQKILVRFIIAAITANSCHFEQSFSTDNGKTWEINWIADDTRIKK